MKNFIYNWRLSLIVGLLCFSAAWSHSFSLSEKIENDVYGFMHMQSMGKLELHAKSAGNFAVQAGWGTWQSKKVVAGYTPFTISDVFLHLGYARKLGLLEVAQTIMLEMENTSRIAKSGSLKVAWNLRPEQIVKIEGEYGTQRATPFLRVAQTDVTVARGLLGVTIYQWEAEASFTRKLYPSIPRPRYSKLIADTAFFFTFYDMINPAFDFIEAKTDPILENSVDKFSVSFWGPVRPWLYSGASYEYANSTRSHYMPMSDYENGIIDYTYFLYETPQKYQAITGILAVAPRLPTDWNTPLKVTGKIPLFSQGRYRSFFQAGSNILGGFSDFYYTYQSLAPMSIEIDISPAITKNLTLSISGKWESRPYTAWSFFSSNAYQSYSGNAGLTLNW